MGNSAGNTHSLVQSSNKDPEPPEIEDISSEGELSDSDQEEPHSGTPAQAQAQAQMRPLAPAKPPRPAPAYFPQPHATPPPGGREACF